MVRGDAGPGDLRAGAVSGRALAVEDRDLPLLDVGVLAAEGVLQVVAEGAGVLGRGPHGLLVAPRRGDDAAAVVAVRQHGQADAAVGVADRRQHFLGHVLDAVVELLRIAADAGGPRVHAAPQAWAS